MYNAIKYLICMPLEKAKFHGSVLIHSSACFLASKPNIAGVMPISGPNFAAMELPVQINVMTPRRATEIYWNMLLRFVVMEGYGRYFRPKSPHIRHSWVCVAASPSLTPPLSLRQWHTTPCTLQKKTQSASFGWNDSNITVLSILSVWLPSLALCKLSMQWKILVVVFGGLCFYLSSSL